MELKKKKVYMSRQAARMETQVTLDDDCNVPDQKSDMESIVLERGEVVLTDQRLHEERMELSGNLEFAVLYQTEDGGMDSLSGAVPFSELVNMPGAADRDHVQVQWVVEDLSISMIHSRKLNVKAVISFVLTAERLFEEEIVWDAEAEGTFETREKRLAVTQMAVQKRDTFRVREDVELGGSKPNIGRMLFSSLTLGGVEFRPGDMELLVRGECNFLAVYQSEEEHMPVQWLEKTIPFSGTMELPDCTDDMIPDIQARLAGRDIEAKPDYDGENRVIHVEGVLELDMKLYEEAEISMVDDVYVPDRELAAEYGTAEFESLLGRNKTKSKLTGKIPLQGNERLLQICHGEGTVSLDRTEITEDGLQVSGTLQVTVLYISADDQRPMKSCRQVFPYSQLVELRGMDAQARYRVTPALEQLSVQMGSGEEMEVRAQLAFDVIALKKENEQILAEVREMPLDQRAIDAMPGIVGYIVQPGDTLWTLAKRYRTTMGDIQAVNHLQGEDLAPGTKLLIVKRAEEL